MIYHSAEKLYQELLHRGFDPKAKIGRDDVLYLRLKEELQCPSSMGIKKYLKVSQLSAGDFIVAFFRIAEPFSLMYRDIYSVMKQHRARRGTESIRIRFDFDGSQFDIDFSEFEEWVRTQSIIRDVLESRLWGMSDFQKLYHFFNMLGAKPNFQRQNRRYDPKAPYDVLLPVASSYSELDNSLMTIYHLLNNTAADILQANKPRQERFTDVLSELSNNRDVDKNEEQKRSILTNPSFTREVFPSLLYAYEDLLAKITAGTFRTDRISDALAHFKKLVSSLNIERREGEMVIENFLKILDLPFWKYRWFVYEVWTAAIVVRVLSSYQITLNLQEGNILPLTRGRESVLGEFCDKKNEVYFVVAQRQTRLVNVLNRKGICPDLRITKNPGSHPDDTVVIVECKQRYAMKKKALAENIELYELGAPKSFGNIFVNYDEFPEIALKSVKTQLFSVMHPNNTSVVQSFEKALAALLSDADILPRSPQFDALLLDISGSMRNAYNDEQLQGLLLAFIEQNTGICVFYFNDDLIQPDQLPQNELLSTIRLRISGGTSLQKTLTSLNRANPGIKRVALLTDGAYGRVEPRLYEKYELVECMPSSMGTKKALWEC